MYMLLLQWRDSGEWEGQEVGVRGMGRRGRKGGRGMGKVYGWAQEMEGKDLELV